MRILDVDRDRAVWNAQLYLTVPEARELVEKLGELLAEPDANEHFHLFSADGDTEVSCSLLTAAKVARLETYTEREQRLIRRNE